MMNKTTPRRSAQILLLLGLAAAGTGCAGVKPRDSATFQISYDEKGCPTDAVVPEGERNCTCWLSTKPDCVRVRRGATVVFEKAPLKAGKAELAAKEEKPFEIFFDPFQTVALPRTEGRIQVKVAADAPYKSYPFNIAAKECKTIDPTIIVDY